METLIEIFGTVGDLNSWQMTIRALIVFLYTLLLIRISGRRSFGLRTAFDNIILILLGAILSRAVVGASPFMPTLIAGLVICLLHRSLAWIFVMYPDFDNFFNGSKIPLYINGKIISHNLRRGLINLEDLQREIRLKTMYDSFDGIESIYMEQNGEISTVKKSNEI